MAGWIVGTDAWKQRMLGEFVVGMRRYREKIDEPDRDIDYKRFEQSMMHLVAHCLMGEDNAKNVEILKDKIREE